MANKDTTSKQYMKFNDYFMDAVNYALYDGEEVVTELREFDTTELVSTPSGSVQKARDVFKQVAVREDDRYRYLFVGIENQATVDRNMPLRCALYDALSYDAQIGKIRKNNEGTDVKPVLTIVIYYGANRWTGPKSIHERLEIEETLKNYVADYRINLIEPAAIEDFGKFRTDFGRVLEFMKYSDDKEKLEKLTQEKRFKEIDKASGMLINTYSRDVKLNIEKDRKEKFDMGNALVEIRDEGIAMGRAETKDEMILSMIGKGFTTSDIADVAKVSVEYVEELQRRQAN